MADVKPEADVKASIFVQMADVIAILSVACGRPLECMLQHVKVADVIAQWQME